MTSFLKDRHKREQQERMVQKQVSPDFLDPAHERRRLFVEAWGTFLLVVVAAGGGVVAAKSGGAVTLGMIVVAPGLMVMAIIYFMGTVSGAQLNPAVTLAFATQGSVGAGGSTQTYEQYKDCR
jgi:aquaporin Z